MKTLVDVILPLPLRGYFTYLLPEEMEERTEVGCRVIVPFGRKKYYTGIVQRIHHEMPQDYEVKEVDTLLDEVPVLLPYQFKLWRWISDYYLCSEGDVYKAALPAGLKLESETVVVDNPEYECSGEESEKEQTVLRWVGQEKMMSVTRLERDTGIKNILTVVKQLLDRGAISVKEEMRSLFKPKVETRVRLQDSCRTEETLRTAFMLVAKAPKQEAVLMAYLDLSGHPQGEDRIVTKKELLKRAGTTAAVFNGLVEKGILEQYEAEIGRLDDKTGRMAEMHPLNEAQSAAFRQIHENFDKKDVCLLYGVTSSGKTEIYIHLIQEAISQGKQVLYLLPEIALTTQITERLKRVFGSKLGIYHSKFPDAERVEIWKKQLSDHPYQIILGVRSSVFLPFHNLGLVIVDEEHENSYKQQDPAPRYNAKNLAIVMGSMIGAKVLLGTATPAIESWFNAITGKYGMVRLSTRYKDIQLPEIVPVDIKELYRKKRMKGSFSPLLVEHIEKALENGEQVILFQNRRGFAPIVECRTCGWVPKCKHCDVSLTYHRQSGKLNCHYCGYTIDIPRRCPACGGTEIRHLGIGTERIEDEIKTLFPDARVARMDFDTTRTRTAYEKIIEDFQEHRTDILIGTQMVSKGLDFDKVSIVGILNADTMLNFPDFRAYERAYQLIAQVAGRAGRKGKQGKVILQTKSIDHQIIPQVMANNYEGMVKGQLEERAMFHYPPHFRLIYVYLKHKKEAQLEWMANIMADRLRHYFGNRVLGPDKPPVARIQALYIRKIVLKVEQKAPVGRVREILATVQQEIAEDEKFKSLMVYYDVDPM